MGKALPNKEQGNKKKSGWDLQENSKFGNRSSEVSAEGTHSRIINPGRAKHPCFLIRSPVLHNMKIWNIKTHKNTWNIKIKIHSSCETEAFVETHLCNLCVILYKYPVQQYLKNGKIHFSCEIDRKVFLIKTRLCKLRVILRSRVLRGVYTLVTGTAVLYTINRLIKLYSGASCRVGYVFLFSFSRALPPFSTRETCIHATHAKAKGQAEADDPRIID